MVFKRRESEGFERQSFFGVLMTPFRSVQEWFGDAISGDDSFRDDKGNAAVRLLTLPLRLLWGFAVFMVQAWTTSRNGIAFLRGLPAFGIFAFTPFLIWALDFYDRQISLGPTIGYHQMHQRNEDFDYALMFSKKLVDLRPDDREFKYLMAEDTYRDGDVEKAKDIMNYLAGELEPIPGEDEASKTDSDVAADDSDSSDVPAEGTANDIEEPEVVEEERFAKAHVWLAQQLIREQQREGGDKEKSEKAMNHLKAAVEVDPDNVLAKVNLIDLYLTRAQNAQEGTEEETENLRLAKDAMVKLTNYESFSSIYQILAMPKLINVCKKLGEEAEAKRALNDATAKVTRIARQFPDVFEIWSSLVQSAIALPDYPLAEDFIREGLQSVKTEENQRKILQLASLAYMQQADDFKDVSTESAFCGRLFALCTAIKNNPRDVQIYDRMADFIDVELGGTERDVWLRNSIIDCPIPGVVHMIIGTRELIRGDISGGKTSWDIAQHQYAATEYVIHRLLSVAIKKKPKLGDGELLDTALELFPDLYMLHETRGVVLKNKGQYEKAIAEFKYVEERMPSLITVHKHLKDCYEKTNNLEAAQASAAKVEEILDEMETKKREFYENALDKI